MKGLRAKKLGVVLFATYACIYKRGEDLHTGAPVTKGTFPFAEKKG